MTLSYFNFHSHFAYNSWDRWDFIRNWWRIYASDPFWTPPYYPKFRRLLVYPRHRHVLRMRPLYLYLEALPRRQGRQYRAGFSGPVMEQPVAAAVVLADPRRKDGTAYLSLLRCANDANSLRRLLEVVGERLARQGYRQLIGPTGLSPHLGSGLLQDFWNETPPLHSPYNPPFLPEIAGAVMRPRSSAKLYHLSIPSEPVAPAPPPAALSPLSRAHFTALLPSLLKTACPPWLNFVPPDTDEANFLLKWLEPWPVWGWLARIDNEPAGFVLVQPDFGPALRQARGGRSPLGWLWLRWRMRRPTRRGRIVFLGVAPHRRKQGLGRQLIRQALEDARQRNWQAVTIGPVPVTAPAAGFLEHLGANPRQTYLLYQHNF